MTTYISNRASAYGRTAPYRQNVKHIVAQGHTTVCGKNMSDPYTIRAGDHALCAKCAKLADRS